MEMVSFWMHRAVSLNIFHDRLTLFISVPFLSTGFLCVFLYRIIKPIRKVFFLPVYLKKIHIFKISQFQFIQNCNVLPRYNDYCSRLMAFSCQSFAYILKAAHSFIFNHFIKWKKKVQFRVMLVELKYPPPLPLFSFFSSSSPYGRLYPCGANLTFT